MRYLDEFPKIENLLKSTNRDDVLIGVELLKMKNLTEEELLWMLPKRDVSNKRRDINSGGIFNRNEWFSISKNISMCINSTWIFCDETKNIL